MSVLRVFDSWAVMAWLLNEPAAGHVRDLIDQAYAADLRIAMSWINSGEVYYMLRRKAGRAVAEEFVRRCPALPIRFVVPQAEDFIAAARIKATRRLSYADAFAADLAIQSGAILVTGDPELRAMSDLIQIDWIGA